MRLLALIALLFLTPAVALAQCAQVATYPPRTPGTQNVVVDGGPQTAPAAAAVLVDSGPIFCPVALCNWIVDLECSNTSDTTANQIGLHHRNAGNTADIDTPAPFGIGAFTSVPLFAGQQYICSLASNERVRAQIAAAATSSKVWQCELTVYPTFGPPG